MIKKALRPSILLLAFTLFIAPATRMYADCNIVTGCDPVPPPEPPIHHSIITIILIAMGLS